MKKLVFCILITVLFLCVASCVRKTENYEDKRNENFCQTYTYEKDGMGGDFSIQLFNDGSYKYSEGLYSSYYGVGVWIMEGDILVLADETYAEPRIINRFQFDENDLIFNEEDSTNFTRVKIADGEKFLRVAQTEAKDN